MVDYNKLTDFEINSAVHNYLMENPYKIYFLGEDKIRWVRGDTDVVTDKVPYKKVHYLTTVTTFQMHGRSLLRTVFLLALFLLVIGVQHLNVIAIVVLIKTHSGLL